MYGTTSLIATAILLPLLGVIAVCLRFYVRLRLKPTFIGIDDWMIAFSCLLVCASGANQVVGMSRSIIESKETSVPSTQQRSIIGATLGEVGRDEVLTDTRRMYVQSKVRHAGSALRAHCCTI